MSHVCISIQCFIAYQSSQDTEDYVDLAIWSNIEVPVGVICACMPSLRSLFRHMFPRLPSTKISFFKDTAGSSAPKLSKTSIVQKSLSSKPHHEDERSFVQLVELDSVEGQGAKD